jgi:hypothetical protein
MLASWPLMRIVTISILWMITVFVIVLAWAYVRVTGARRAGLGATSVGINALWLLFVLLVPPIVLTVTWVWMRGGAR